MQTRSAAPHLSALAERRFLAKLSKIDWLVALVLFAATLAWYVHFESPVLWGDGIPLFQEMELDWRDWWWLHYHAAFIPVAKLLAYLHPSPVAYHGYVLASSVPIAGATALSYLSARLLGCVSIASAAAALLVGAAPFACFFGTILEVHGLHMGAVALAVFGSLAAGRVASTSRFVALHLVLFLPIGASHTTALFLAPGWAIWQTYVVSQQRPDLIRRAGTVRAFLLFGAAAAVWFVVTLGVIELSWRLHGMGSSTAFMAGTVREHVKPFQLSFFETEWILPLGWGAPLLAVALLAPLVTPIARRLDAPARRLILVATAAVLPPLVAFNCWNVRYNEGGYLAGIAPFFVLVLAAFDRALPRGTQRWIWRTLLLVAATTQWYVSTRQTEHVRADELRTRPAIFDAAKALLPEGGGLITMADNRWNIAASEPLFDHVDLEYIFRRNADGSYMRDIRTFLSQRLAKFSRSAVLDVSYRADGNETPLVYRDRLREMEAILAEEYSTSAPLRTSGPAVVLRARAR